MSVIVAIDQGTTSTRCILFDRAGGIVASAQKEHKQIYPQSGWVEHDAVEIWNNTREVLAKAATSGAEPACIGITNQRETTVIWNRDTGKPYHNAIVWQDTRTQKLCDDLKSHQALFRSRTGLPVATYFSATKIRWLLDHVPGLRDAARWGDAIFGTIDTFLAWNLSGQHITDVTNASRTMLMNLNTLQWDDELLSILDIPIQMLPKIVPSVLSEGAVSTRDGGSICGILGDQQAALFGQCCFESGDAKNTYGTGCFLLMNIGNRPVASKAGLLTTVGYQLSDGSITYALEGSIAITGSLVQWLRDNLKMIDSSAEIEALARSVPDNGGVYFVPAFSGLFAPHWRSDARGTIVGMTGFTNRGHIARAVLEASAYQTADVVDAIVQDCGTPLTQLKVDGGMTSNELLMQFQADILGVPVVRPSMTETTALGAAYAAGLGAGVWKSTRELQHRNTEMKRWTPGMPTADRTQLRGRWSDAVARSLGWVQ